MQVELPSLSFQIRSDLAAAGLDVPLGHVQQLIAAAFGYGSLAAYQAATTSATVLAHRPPSVLYVREIERRLHELSYDATPARDIAGRITAGLYSTFNGLVTTMASLPKVQSPNEVVTSLKSSAPVSHSSPNGARKRTPFNLPIEPDPWPELMVERGPRDEGVGTWVPDEKHTLLAKFLGGTRAARAKWPERVLIDPFCGPGRIQVKGRPGTREGGAVVAWRQSCRDGSPFTKVLIGDIDRDRVRACERRLQKLDAPVNVFAGPAAETALQMAKAVPPRALALAYLDPYNLEFLSFDIIEALGRLPHVDFVVHFSTMDLQRNVDLELDGSRARFDDAAPGWRTNLNVKSLSKTELRQAFFGYWMSLVRDLGFTFSHEKPLVRGERGEPLYRLVSFSRHALPNAIWDDVAKSDNYELFQP